MEEDYSLPYLKDFECQVQGCPEEERDALVTCGLSPSTNVTSFLQWSEMTGAHRCQLESAWMTWGGLCDCVSQSCLTLCHPWTAAHQPPLSMGFPRQVGCHALLQRIYPTQGLNLHLLHCRRFLYWLSHWPSKNLQSTRMSSLARLYLGMRGNPRQHLGGSL